MGVFSAPRRARSTYFYRLLRCSTPHTTRADRRCRRDTARLTHGYPFDLRPLFASADTNTLRRVLSCSFLCSSICLCAQAVPSSKKKHMRAATAEKSNMFELLNGDVLSIILIQHLDIHRDVFATAFVCRAFYCKFRKELSGPFWTLVDAMLCNAKRIDWACRQGCPHDHLTCAAAAPKGNIEVLKYLLFDARARGTSGRALMRRLAVTSRCCSGRAIGTARGTSGRALMRLKAATSRCCSGCTLRAAHGTSARALVRRNWRPPRCCSGRALRAAHGRADVVDAAGGGHLEVLQWARAGCRGTRKRALMRLKAATSRCCSGRALRAARGTLVRAL